MDRIYYKSSKFTTKGEAFETPSGLGGTFNVIFLKTTKEGGYVFRRPRKRDWPAATYIPSQKNSLLQRSFIRYLAGSTGNTVMQNGRRNMRNGWHAHTSTELNPTKYANRN